MEFKNLLYDIKDEIGVLTINRPEKLNALNSETVSEIGRAMDAIKGDDNIKVVILTGAGDKAFVAGADVSEFVGIGLKEGFEFSRNFHAMTRKVETMGKPVIFL